MLDVSRRLTLPKQHYAAIEGESLTIKWAVEEPSYYLVGPQFTLVTDHKPLQWMSKAKNSNTHITWWFRFLQDLSFRI